MSGGCLVAALTVVAKLTKEDSGLVPQYLRRWRRLAQSSEWHYVGSLRSLTSGWRLKPPEVGGFTSACLRRLPEVFGLTSGGFSEVSHGAKYGEFSVVAIFTRRLCGVFALPTPEDPQISKPKPGLLPRLPPGVTSGYLRSLRNFGDQDLMRRLIDYVIARN